MINYKHIKGFSLLELMITMAIFSIVATSIIQVLDASYRAKTYQESLIQTQDSAYAGISLVAEDLSNAGLNNEVDPFQKSPFNWGVTETLVGGNDTVSFTYSNENAGQDLRIQKFSCGDPTPDQVSVTNVYRVQDIAGEQYLTCNGIRILKGVRLFKVWYGVDLDGDTRADRYTNDTLAESASINSEQRVVSLKLYILVESDEDLTGFGSDEDINFLGLTFDTNPNRVYRSYSKHINLKNLY